MAFHVLLKLTGMRFGRLVVISEQPVDRVGTQHKVRWLCRCDCGTELPVQGQSLRTGNTQSCGCRKLEIHTKRLRTHGQTDAPAWRSWMGMRQRCQLSSSPIYRYYGGRGISACPEWEDFETFFRDMGPRPPGMSIDRIDNDGNYEPGNCRWATPAEQKRNSRGVQNVTIGPLTMCIADWAAESGKDRGSIKRALLRGDPPARAVYG